MCAGTNVDATTNHCAVASTLQPSESPSLSVCGLINQGSSALLRQLEEGPSPPAA
jgi:hypothetical protein